MLRTHNPDGVAPPFSTYSHAVEVPANARWLYVSGQVGVRPDGSLAAGFDAQAEQAWRNVIAILGSAGMGLEDLVRLNTYITREEDVAGVRRVRDRFIKSGNHAHLESGGIPPGGPPVESGGIPPGGPPASTLVVIPALAAPDWLFEMEAVAAKA